MFSLLPLTKSKFLTCVALCRSCSTRVAFVLLVSHSEVDILGSPSSESNSSSGSENKFHIDYYQWVMINRRFSKVKTSLSCANIQKTFSEKLAELKYYIFVRSEEYKVYDPNLHAC